MAAPTEIALFAGAGGGVLASRLLGHRIVCYVEREPYCVEVLKARIAGGLIDDAPIWDDVRTFDGKPWRGIVDIVSGGFPCQPFSAAGKQRGADDERNCWPDVLRLVREIRPSVIFLENVAALVVSGYFGTVLGGLAESGYDARWDCIPASAVGAPHQRDRVWIVGSRRGLPDAECDRLRLLGERGRRERSEPWTPESGDERAAGAMADASGRRLAVLRSAPGQAGHVDVSRADVADPDDAGRFEQREPIANAAELASAQRGHSGLPDTSQQAGRWELSGRRLEQSEGGAEARSVPDSEGERLGPGLCAHEPRGLGRRRPGDLHHAFGLWPAESGVCRVAHGVADRVDRLTALGNGQVPRVAVAAFRALGGDLT